MALTSLTPLTPLTSLFYILVLRSDDIEEIGELDANVVEIARTEIVALRVDRKSVV